MMENIIFWFFSEDFWKRKHFATFLGSFLLFGQDQFLDLCKSVWKGWYYWVMGICINYKPIIYKYKYMSIYVYDKTAVDNVVSARCEKQGQVKNSQKSFNKFKLSGALWHALGSTTPPSRPNVKSLFLTNTKKVTNIFEFGFLLTHL